MYKHGFVLGVWLILTHTAQAASFAEQAAFDYDVYADVVYSTVNDIELKADVYVPVSKPDESGHPVLLYWHGGGWVYNTRHNMQLRLLPYLEKKFVVVNLDYRKWAQSGAPAAVEDARCALNWLRQNAQRFSVDLSRIVVSGNSAGGHLAMMAAYTTSTNLFDRHCWDGPGPAVAAVINWYGITDVADLIEGNNTRAYAVQWIGDHEQALQLAQRVSPMRYVSVGGVPTFTVHGDRDTIVPYQHAVQLHTALTRAGQRNHLMTINKAGHGDFSAIQVNDIYQQIWTFLRQQKIIH